MGVQLPRCGTACMWTHQGCGAGAVYIVHVHRFCMLTPGSACSQLMLTWCNCLQCIDEDTKVAPETPSKPAENGV